MKMEDLLKMLPAKGRRGSLPRCALFTHGSKSEVASRLTALVAPHGVVDPNTHQWCPTGFQNWKEIELDKSRLFLTDGQRHEIADWWLAARRHARTPTWDLVSQANIGGSQGLILIEAKAHSKELKGEECGKRLDDEATDNSHKNHDRIGPMHRCRELRPTFEHWLELGIV